MNIASIKALSIFRINLRPALRAVSNAPLAKPAQPDWSVIRAKVNQLFNQVKDSQSQERLGNFEIQQSLSEYNSAQQLAENVTKKNDDTSGAIISRVG